MRGFDKLPVECVAAILSHTTPVDAGRFSVVSKTFRSAADSDAVWNHFLRSDPKFIDFIISHSPPSIANVPTKKALYLALSDRPIIVKNGEKSIQLDRKSGKRCVMLAAKSLGIAWDVDDDRYWKWIPMPDSRFPEVAEFVSVWMLEICGEIKTRVLSPNTQYAAYLVYKMIPGNGLQNNPMYLSVGVKGSHKSTKIVFLDQTVELECMPPNIKSILHRHAWTRTILQRPSVRRDGWLEIEMGEFFNLGLKNKKAKLSVKQIEVGLLSGNFFLEGIEVRPKEEN